ncbi:hypothetical protein Nepgr_010105 [Nepenthes gracilis]|uniref:F-box domain-containing protein n=1 Tax=Nepenthes gracilis TaxID=150966 RepID=A0AAD3XL07_NEPGR|nr:hypothetical protein Nepgr_010105 [Nepenthes gracilis]
MAGISQGEPKISGNFNGNIRCGIEEIENSKTTNSQEINELDGIMEKSKKRRREKREENSKGGKDEGEGRESLSRDPLVVLGWDLMMKILSYLDASSVALSLLVSRGWNRVASNDSLWAPMCEELWIGKAHIPRWSKVPGLSKMAAYSRAVTDSKRGRIMRDDLCDHAWEFHFTRDAPDYWRNLDPYWKGTAPLMRRYFHPDGSHSADPGDKVWGGHESCYSVVTSFLADGKIRKHYVRINRWPQLFVSRRQDWGWEMSNFLCKYSSIPDSFKGGTGPLFQSM